MSKLSFLEMYRQIVATQSISAFDEDIDQSNEAIISLLANWLESIGFGITIQKVPGGNNKQNLLATIGQGEGGVLLAGHSDTVPVDSERWHSDPFTLLEQDSKLFGLGTCDMKGFFAFVIEALSAIPLNKLNKPLYILATADEETTMAGARFFAQQPWIRPDVAIIGEPTEMRPIIKHKGHMGHALTVTGKAGHSSDPAGGVNAIDVVHQAIGRLLDYRQRLAQSYSDTSFAVPEPTLNLGHIQGGDAENRICAHCRLHFDLRPTPALPDADVMQQLHELMLPLEQAYPRRIQRRLLYPSIPAFASRNETKLVELAEQLTGLDAATANYCTEAPFLSQLGCDTIVMGPGSIEQAHQPNEFMSLSYVEPTIGVLRKVITHYCLIE